MIESNIYYSYIDKNIDNNDSIISIYSIVSIYNRFLKSSKTREISFNLKTNTMKVYIVTQDFHKDGVHINTTIEGVFSTEELATDMIHDLYYEYCAMQELYNDTNISVMDKLLHSLCNLIIKDVVFPTLN